MEKWVLPAVGILVAVIVAWFPFLYILASLLGLYLALLANFNCQRPLPYLSLAPAAAHTSDSGAENLRIVVNWFAKASERTACRLFLPAAHSNLDCALYYALAPMRNIYTGKYSIHSVTLPALPPGTEFEYEIVNVPPKPSSPAKEGGESPKLTSIFGRRRFRFRSPSSSFPAAGENRPLRVAAFGDLQPKAKIPPLLQWWILHQIRRTRPDLVFFLGDHTMEGTVPAGWVQFYRLLGPIACQTPVLGVPGNHDTNLHRKGGPRQIMDAFETYVNYPAPKSRYFLRVYGLQLFAFDFTSGFGAGSPNLQILERNLPSLRADEWVVVLWHSSPHNTVRPDEAVITLRKSVIPRLDARGCRLWLGGHEHSYQRFRVGDTYYITTAATSSFHFHRANEAFLEKLVMKFHFVQLEITPDIIHVRATSLRNAVLDEFQIQRLKAANDCQGN